MDEDGSMTQSEELFARARRLIPGGVSSPVRAFKAVGGSPLFIRWHCARCARLVFCSRLYGDKL